MAFLAIHSFPFPQSRHLLPQNPNPNSSYLSRIGWRTCRRSGAQFVASSKDPPENYTKLVTFLGKGGSGKTTAAVLAAQYYAKEGLRTCLVIQSQDPTAEYLMGCNIGTSPTVCNKNLSAVKLETTKMLLEPLDRMKKADARINLTQGVLEGVVGEELGVLPGMDSIFSALAIEKLVAFLESKESSSRREFDVIVFDGLSTEETLRMIGAAERTRWYLKYVRNMAEKTDIGRLTAPSLLKLTYESVRLNGGNNDGKMSAEIWDDVERILERASLSFTDSSKFRCYLVMDPCKEMSVIAAVRYWGCAIQAGAQIAGAFCFAPESHLSLAEVARKKILPLPFALVPYLSTDSPVNWDITLDSLGEKSKELLCTSRSNRQSLVNFDRGKKSVTLFMPGFNKSEIKLYQFRGGSELLVEAGDQRRVICLPLEMQGKVSGAKFVDRSLVVTLR